MGVENGTTGEAEQIGPYRVVARLASGGMSEILLARRRGPVGLEQLVVIKRMLPELVRDPEVRGALIDEARVMLGLRHPNVGAVQELACDDDGFYLVMEYLRGDNLLALCRALRAQSVELPLPLAVHIAMEVCAGLHAAHELTDEEGEPLHVIHRDVSPQNVFVTFDGEVKLIDFGIARYADRHGRTKSGVVKGKFAYMAPEQFCGEPLDRRTDVFAVGVVLHELLTGHRLFARSSDKDTLMAILSGPVPRPSERAPARGISIGLDEICMRALARDPHDRFATAAEMRRALREQLGALDPSCDARDALAQLARRVLPTRLAEVDAHRRRRARRSSERITLRALGRVDPDASSESSESSAPRASSAPRSASPAGSGSPDAPGRARPSASIAEEVEASGALELDVEVELPPPGPTRRARPRALWALGAVALGLAGIGLGLLATFARPPDPPATVAAPPAPAELASDGTVRVTVETVPAGSAVRVAGELRGFTPLELELPYQLAPVELGLELDGYEPMTQTVVPDQRQRVLFQLAPRATER